MQKPSGTIISSWVLIYGIVHVYSHVYSFFGAFINARITFCIANFQMLFTPSANIWRLFLSESLSSLNHVKHLFKSVKHNIMLIFFLFRNSFLKFSKIYILVIFNFCMYNDIVCLHFIFRMKIWRTIITRVYTLFLNVFVLLKRVEKDFFYIFFVYCFYQKCWKCWTRKEKEKIRRILMELFYLRWCCIKVKYRPRHFQGHTLRGQRCQVVFCRQKGWKC